MEHSPVEVDRNERSRQSRNEAQPINFVAITGLGERRWIEN